MAMNSSELRQEADAQHGEEDVSQRILRLYKGAVSKVVLVGKAGIGKTWVARETCRVSKEEGSSYLALWLNLSKKFNERSLYEDIAAQLFLFHEYEETGDVDGKEKERDLKNEIHKELIEKKDSYKAGQFPSSEEKKMKPAKGGKKSASKAKGEKSSAEGMISAQTAAGNNLPKQDIRSKLPGVEKYLLLILDDEGSFTKEDEVMTKLGLQNFLDSIGPLKILITRRGDDSSTNHREEPKIITEKASEKIEAASEDTSQASLDPVNKDETILLESPSSEKIQELLDFLTKNDSRGLLEKTWGISEATLKAIIMRESRCLPAAVVVLIASLHCIMNRPEQEGDEYIKKVLRSVVPSNFDDSACGSQSSISPINRILHLGYELLKCDDKLHKATVDCFWHSLDFFEHSGCVYYRDLITQWILEGYFDPVMSVEKIYQDGYSIFMEFINRRILKIQDNNVVVPEVAMNSLIDLRRRGFFGRSHLGLSRVYGGDKTKGLGRITVIDDSIKTVQTNKQGEKLSTVLISGNRLRREAPKKFFEMGEMKDLEVLGLFNPTLELLVNSISKEMKNLRFLVIRGFDLLDTIDELKVLKRLQVLEVSGASSLKNIPGDFFEGMSQLQSLNLSGLRIKSSPYSISGLKELCFLILRDCPELEDLPDLKSLEKLEVIDYNGALELKTCFDYSKLNERQNTRQNKSKNKNFHHLTKLQHLDLSESQIERLPLFQDSASPEKLGLLTRLLLHNCTNLRRLPNLKPLSGLQILDLSGTTSLMEMFEVCFEDKRHLRILDLSRTNLTELPCTISELYNLNELLLKDCVNLEALPNIEELRHLEVFDVSGCNKLANIEGSFAKMSYLREVSLCGTKLKALPEFPEQSSLSCSKKIVLSNSVCVEGEDWTIIRKEIQSRESSSSSETHTYICPEKKLERFGYEDNRHEDLYMKSEQFIHPHSSLQIVKFQSSKPNEDKGTRTEPGFVSFVDIRSTSVSKAFEEFKLGSVKGCWLKRCRKMTSILSAENDKNGERLETLCISYLPLLTSFGGSPGNFENLRKLSIDCCPKITMFLLPASLEVLHIKFCDRLEKVEKEKDGILNLLTLHLVELPLLSHIGAILPKLKAYETKNCPMLKDITKESLIQGTCLEHTCENDSEIVEHSGSTP